MSSAQRKPLAVLALLVILAVWVVGAVTIGDLLAGQSPILQMIYYVVAGIGWVLPVRPVFYWMNSAPDLKS